MIVRVVSAIGGGVVDVDVPETSTVNDVKTIVSKEKKIPASTVLLVFRGRQLGDNEILAEAGIGAYDKVYLITRTEGGIYLI
ncbi:MAG: ubiquitin-like domain-containing protein [Promethearchaeota archaeon]